MAKKSGWAVGHDWCRQSVDEIIKRGNAEITAYALKFKAQRGNIEGKLDSTNSEAEAWARDAIDKADKTRRNNLEVF